MKKLLLSLLVVVFAFTQLHAQESVFKKGDKVVNLGIGFGSTWGLGLYEKTAVPAISASMEVGIVSLLNDKATIGVGGYIGYSSFKSSISSTYYWTNSDLIIGARGAFHYALLDKLDTYAGLILGARIESWKEHGTGYGFTHSTGSGIASSEFVGARYYFSNSFAVMGELGYGITWLNLGVALKF